MNIMTAGIISALDKKNIKYIVNKTKNSVVIDLGLDRRFVVNEDKFIVYYSFSDYDIIPITLYKDDLILTILEDMNVPLG